MQRNRIRAPRGSVGAFGVAVLLACACAEAPVPDTQDAPPPTGDRLLLASARVGLPPGGVMARDLPDPDGRGAQIAGQFCGTCHALPTPALHAAVDWPVVLRRMWLRMTRLDSAFAVPVPSTAERIVLSEYFVSHAFQTAGSLPDGTGREDFTGTCGRCHALPDPQQHARDDWVTVVRRMSGHMEEMLGEVPDRESVARIVGYLENLSQ